MSFGNLFIIPLAVGLGTAPGSPAALTSGEINALMSQLVRCWSLPALPKGIGSVAVDIDVTVNPDRMVGHATVADQARYARDPVFRAIADSALKALHEPNCSPLALPAAQYDFWKFMTIHFDPEEVSGQ